jgi:dTDP-4-amino-4,6-dideoxygalactose transaminase/CelD/BcsL family acetyltransferase involved in cellulose biosynthesis
LTVDRRLLTLGPSLPLDVYSRRPADQLPFPLDRSEGVLFSKARQGLRVGLQALGLRPGEEVLVPAYHHGSEVEALVRAGLVCRFFDVAASLEPDEGALDDLVTPQTRALYLIHYFGFPQDSPRWQAWCERRGLILIEDAAQAWLATVEGEPVGSFGSLAIFCVYKTFALPDGGAVISSSPAPAPRPRSDPLLVSLAKNRAWISRRSGWLSRGQSRPSGDAHEDFGAEHAARAPSPATLMLLPRVVDGGAAARRRANYRLLLDELADFVPPGLAQLPEGASPLIFPIETHRREELIERLEARSIGARPFWQAIHPLLDAPRFPGAFSWRDRLVALPVHQELRPQDLERIAAAVRGRPLKQSGLRLQPLTELDSLRDEWSDLAERSTNIFSTWEWASLWWRHFGEGRRLLSAACRHPDGRLVAVLPLYLSSSLPLRVVRLLGHGPGDQLGPVCDPRDRIPAARALRRWLLDDVSRWDVFLAEELPGDEGWSALLGGQVLERQASPVLRFRDASWETFLASLSSRLRHELRHDAAKLAREHDVRYRLADDPSRLQEDLDTLFRLHSARWGGRETPFGGAREAFHRDFASCALERGWLRLWFVELDGEPVATWYGFRFGGVESSYQTGRDPAWRRSSVGLVLLAHAIRQALEEGVREYRFLRGDEPYKRRLANRDPGLETIAVPGGAAGRAALTARAVARRSTTLRSAARRLRARR